MTSSKYLNMQVVQFIDVAVKRCYLLHFKEPPNCQKATTVSHKVDHKSGSEVIKLSSCSTQLSMKIFLLINDKMPTIVGILVFMSRKNSYLCLCESE